MFKTEKEAVKYMSTLVDLGLVDSHNNGYSISIPYYLEHGEYERPDYRVTKYKEGWGIKKVYFFYAGSLNVSEDSRVLLSVAEYEGKKYLDEEYG